MLNVYLLRVVPFIQMDIQHSPEMCFPGTSVITLKEIIYLNLRVICPGYPNSYIFRFLQRGHFISANLEGVSAVIKIPHSKLHLTIYIWV